MHRSSKSESPGSPSFFLQSELASHNRCPQRDTGHDFPSEKRGRITGGWLACASPRGNRVARAGMQVAAVPFVSPGHEIGEPERDASRRPPSSVQPDPDDPEPEEKLVHALTAGWRENPAPGSRILCSRSLEGVVAQPFYSGAPFRCSSFGRGRLSGDW